MTAARPAGTHPGGPPRFDRHPGADYGARMADQPLIVCPVCETQQPNAWFCAVCGKALHPLPKHFVGEVPTPALDELEVTVLDPARTNVAVFELEGLDPTLLPAAPVPTPSLPELEPTRAPDLPAVGEEPVPDFESTRLTGDAPTPFAAITCRVCGTPWTPGASRICDGCGVRLSIPDAFLGTKPDAGPRVPVEKTICPSCSARDQVVGDRCRLCGRPVPAKE